MSTVEIIIKVLIALIVTPIVGCLMDGIDRKISAHLQSRVGPPLLQPWYDFR